ncbi:MAG: hypothetical protein QXV42_01185 [Ignisphaera sp.]
MSSSIQSIAFILDISKSMDEHYNYIGKKIEISKQLFSRLSEALFRSIKEPYRLHLYVFPSPIPDAIPCEKVYQLTIVDSYTLTIFNRALNSISRTRPTTPLVESLIYVAKDIEDHGLIITITDGIYIGTSSERISELMNVIEEKDIYIVILCLNLNPENLVKLISNRIAIEVLHFSQLHSLLLSNTIEYIIYTKILPKIRRSIT